MSMMSGHGAARGALLPSLWIYCFFPGFLAADHMPARPKNVCTDMDIARLNPRQKPVQDPRVLQLGPRTECGLTKPILHILFTVCIHIIHTCTLYKPYSLWHCHLVPSHNKKYSIQTVKWNQKTVFTPYFD